MVFRPTRSTIESGAHAVVLFGTEVAAVKGADDKKSAKDKVKRRKLRAAVAALAAKVAAQKKVSSAVAKAQTLRWDRFERRVLRAHDCYVFLGPPGRG